jgi:dTDP-4-dehydrorhamnose reductase
MNIIIYGHQGWIASYIIKYLNNLDIKYYCSQFRVDDEKNIEEEIININPTHMLSLIGRTHGPNYTTIDYLELPGKLVDNIRDNLYSPLYLAYLANKYNIHLTYMGTGCIFNNLNDEKYSEDDKPNFFGSSYSIVKGFTDRIMHLFENNVLNLRIRMPITDDLSDRSFITKILSYEKICSNSNSMSVLPDLIPILYNMMLQKYTGTYNFTNPGSISHNEILDLYKEIINPNFKWKNMTIDEQNNLLLSKRSNNYLDTKKLEDLFEIPDIKTSIKKIFIKFKNKE